MEVMVVDLPGSIGKGVEDVDKTGIGDNIRNGVVVARVDILPEVFIQPGKGNKDAHIVLLEVF